jgi:hypothetical protein
VVLGLSKRVTFVLLALLLSAGVSAEAQFGVPLGRTDPKLESVAARELVARYCRVDYAGARLYSSEWPKIEPLVSWRSNPEFPLMMVTSRFDLDQEPTLEHGKYLISVHYRLLGKYDMAEGYSNESANTIQTVQFVVSEVNDDLRIIDIEPSYPHISRAAVLQWLNSKLAGAQDPASKVMYQHAVQDLQPKGSVPPAQ